MSEEIKPGSLPGNLPEEPSKKNPRRVEAGKKGAEAKRIRALLRKKELEEIKEENQRLREPVLSVTKEPVPLPEKEVPSMGAFAPSMSFKVPALWISAGIIGSIGSILASYFFRRKPEAPKPVKPIKKPGPVIDPFEF